MAISRKFQARATVTQASTASSSPAAPPFASSTSTSSASQVANPDGTVTVTFAGRGLGQNATPAAPPVNVSVENGQFKVLPLE